MKSINLGSKYRNRVVGIETKVPLANGGYVTAINFDNAATTPPLIPVLEEVLHFAPWYSSIHRGTGYKSQLSSNLYDQARRIIGNFVNADMTNHTVIFVKNTTEAINKLSYRLLNQDEKEVVLSTIMEHHSNDLPWRSKYIVDYIQIDESGRLCIRDLENKLNYYKGKVKLVTVTGASNVTGYTNPIHQIASLAHQYNAKILVDGAQLVPHGPMDMRPFNPSEQIDYLVFSAHKMYAPFGIGVLIGPKSTFETREPEYVGGGTIKVVTRDFIQWADPPEREEAGSPNVIGVVALTAAIKTLKSIGMVNIEKYEQNLVEYALHGLRSVEGIQIYGNKENAIGRVGIIPFNIEGIYHGVVATILSQEFGIAVRNGCFCAQPYIQSLLHISPEEIKKKIQDFHNSPPGMVRLSFGLYNTLEEIDLLVEALKKITHNKKYYIEKYHSMAML